MGSSIFGSRPGPLSVVARGATHGLLLSDHLLWRGGYLIPEDFDPAAGDGKKNAAPAIQKMFDAQRDDGVAIGFRHTTYRCDEALTHQRNTTDGPEEWVIHPNGATLDFSSSGLTAGNLVTLGATSQNNAHDTGYIVMPSPLKILGPETGNPASNSPDGTTVGLYLNFCLHGELRALVRRVKTAFKTEFVFDLLSHFVSDQSYIGAHILDDSTYAQWNAFNAVEAHYGLLVQPGTTKNVLNQKFVAPRFETCDVGVHLDPQDGSGIGIRGINLDSPYFESITNDFIRAGVAFDFATPGTRGADRNRGVYNCTVGGGGEWSSGGWTATHAALVFDTAGICTGWDIAIPVERTATSIVNRPNRSKIMTLTDPAIGVVAQVEAELPGEGWVEFDGTDGSIGSSGTAKAGNLDTVTRNSVGNYTLTFRENYQSTKEYIASGSAANAYVDSVNYAVGSVDVLVRDDTGTLVDRASVRVWVKGRLG